MRGRGRGARAPAGGARGASARRSARGPSPSRGPTAIVTGQQAGLFGGPLFVLWKALATIKVARQLEEAARATRRARVLGGLGRPRLRGDPLDEPHRRGRGASAPCATPRAASPSASRPGRSPLDDTIAALVEELGQALPPALGRDEALGGAWRSATGPARRSRRPSRASSPRLLPELVVLDPARPGAEALMAPVLARELREGSPTSRLALEAGRALLAAGYHQQVPVRPGFLNLFVVVEGQRRALGFANGIVEVRGTRERLVRRGGPARASRRTRSAWSPGALLRPLAQDALLPTAAYVGGPAEIAYHAQIAPVLRALRHSPPGAPAPAEPHPRRAAAGPGPRRRAAHPRRPRGRPRGARVALGPRGLSRGRGGVRAARARRSSARWARSRRRSGRTTRRCARPPPRPGAAPSTRSRGSTRRRCAP